MPMFYAEKVKETLVKPWPTFGIYTFTEEGVWVACMRRPYMVGQGKTEAEAIQSLERYIVHQVMIEAMENLPDPPRAVADDATVAKWKVRHAEAHPEETVLPS
jgi:predicted RNase H-like HicB family nuclease